MVFIVSGWFLGHWILHVRLAFWILDGFSGYGSLLGQIAFLMSTLVFFVLGCTLVNWISTGRIFIHIKKVVFHEYGVFT